MNLFIVLRSQWRVGGMGGATGLDYTSVFCVIDRLHRDSTTERKDELFADIQIMESAALKEMAKN